MKAEHFLHSTATWSAWQLASPGRQPDGWLDPQTDGRTDGWIPSPLIELSFLNTVLFFHFRKLFSVIHKPFPTCPFGVGSKPSIEIALLYLGLTYHHNFKFSEPKTAQKMFLIITWCVYVVLTILINIPKPNTLVLVLNFQLKHTDFNYLHVILLFRVHQLFLIYSPSTALKKQQLLYSGQIFLQQPF